MKSTSSRSCQRAFRGEVLCFTPKNAKNGRFSFGFESQQSCGMEIFMSRIKHSSAYFWVTVMMCAILHPSGSSIVYGAQPDKDQENVRRQYEEYVSRFETIQHKDDLADSGFTIVEDQVFLIDPDNENSVCMVPAFDQQYNRLALFFTDANGTIVYKTEQLETNNCVSGQMRQQNQSIAAVSFQDLDGDGRRDIEIITYCVNDKGELYKLGDVLFQKHTGTGFYRDYRIAEKINRFGMNKSTESITAFVRDGYSTEFLYTANTLQELQEHDFQIIAEQCYFRTFGKLGRLQVVPGIYRIADYDIFMIYLVNEQGYIVSSLHPMGKYDNLYALKGINCRDIDGDGLKDIIVWAKYSYEGEGNQLIVESDYSIYYQRTGGFSVDISIKNEYPCSDEDTMESLVQKARAYWGWKIEND